MSRGSTISGSLYLSELSYRLLKSRNYDLGALQPETVAEYHGSFFADVNNDLLAQGRCRELKMIYDYCIGQ